MTMKDELITFWLSPVGVLTAITCLIILIGFIRLI